MTSEGEEWHDQERTRNYWLAEQGGMQSRPKTSQGNLFDGNAEGKL